MSKPSGYYSLREAFAEPGCAFCRILQNHADRYIDATMWELVNDVESRVDFNKALGFCNEHSWMIVRYGASLGGAILMDSVLGVVEKVVNKAEYEAQSSLRQMWGSINTSQPKGGTAGLVKDLEPKAECEVCLAVAKTERYYLETLVSHMTGPDSLAEEYAESDGLCLPHFRKTLSRVDDEATFEALMAAQKQVWQELRAHLKEFIRKKDHRFQHETIGIEGDSWIRGIEAVAGVRPMVNKTDKKE